MHVICRHGIMHIMHHTHGNRWPALGKELKKERELVPHVAYHWEAVGNNLYATMRPKTE
jgi:hypothetical protein